MMSVSYVCYISFMLNGNTMYQVHSRICKL